MKLGKKWNIGVGAFYANVAGGAMQLALVVVRSPQLGLNQVTSSAGAILGGIVMGALIGAAICWVRNLLLPWPIRSVAKIAARRLWVRSSTIANRPSWALASPCSQLPPTDPPKQ